MIRILCFLVLFVSVTSCKLISRFELENDITDVKIDTLFEDNISIRAILYDESKVWYAANNNRVGYFDCENGSRKEIKIVSDTLKIEFRSIAQNKDNIFVLSVANPALLYKISKKTLAYELVYKEIHENVFYDSMQFKDEAHGIAIGDPIQGVASVITTEDGGKSWEKISNEIAPKLNDGEAFFAASNSNVIVQKNKIWMVSGGKRARVFLSDDFGKSWNFFETPIVQGKTMTGIFTADFYDSKHGIIAGGDYELLNQDFSNKAITTDGGKSWRIIADNQGIGYVSCVQFVPKSNGKKLVLVGATGVFYSKDGGRNWNKISDESKLFTVRFLNKKTVIAAGYKKMICLKFD